MQNKRVAVGGTQRLFERDLLAPKKRAVLAAKTALFHEPAVQ